MKDWEASNPDELPGVLGEIMTEHPGWSFGTGFTERASGPGYAYWWAVRDRADLLTAATPDGLAKDIEDAWLTPPGALRTVPREPGRGL